MAIRKNSPGEGMLVPDLLAKNSELVKQSEVLFDSINRAWLVLEDKIASSGVLKPTHVYGSSDGYGHLDVLGIAKVQGKWRIVYATEDEMAALQVEEYHHKWTPITDCNIEARQHLLQFAPNLVQQIFASNTEVVAQLAKAVNESKRFLKSIGITDAQENL